MEQNGLNCRGGSNSAGDADSPSNENGSMSAATTVSPTVNGGPESGNAQLGGMDGIDRRATADLFKRFFFPVIAHSPPPVRLFQTTASAA